MNADIQYLTIFAEIALGMTAFFAIVATLRQSLGDPLSPYQYLITRFFLETGILTTLLTLGALGVATVLQDEEQGWRFLAWSLIVVTAGWQVSYLKRRGALHPAPPSSKTAFGVMVSGFMGYSLLLTVMLGSGAMSIPAATVFLLMINMIGMTTVFFIFVGSFMKVDVEESE
jgi:hypothetical protein